MTSRKNGIEKSRGHFQKHQIVSVILEDVVNRVPSGKKLPGIREFMRLSGCGRPVVEQELRKYVESGKITVQPRRGFFRSGAVKTQQKIILLHNFVYPYNGETFADVFLESLRKVLEEENYEVGFVNFASKSETYFKQVVEALDTDKIFLVGCESIELAEFVHQATPYCVELLPRHELTLGSEVRDSQEMTSIQLNYLFERNYRKIGYFHHVENVKFHTPVEYHRLFEFYRIMAEHGFAVNPGWVFFAPWAWKEFEQSMDHFFALPDLPEAVIIPGSTIPFFYRYCGNRGIEIGKDIGVMGCDTLKRSFKEEVTTITNDPWVIAKTAWYVMKKTLDGQPISCTTTFHIQTGESILSRNVIVHRSSLEK